MRHFKIQLFLSFMLSYKIFFSIPVYSQFDGGSGTEDDPYQVATIEQLQEIRNYTDKHFIQVADIDASETADWNDGRGFIPIGDDIVKFTGIYDGAGFEISGLMIDRSNGILEEQNVGMFGYVEGGQIKNTGLIDVNVSGYQRVGRLVGYNDGQISNSYAMGNVSGSVQVGGLVGRNEGKITNSYSKGDVSGSSSVGGMAGANGEGWISNSYATGGVSGSEDRVGGLVGFNTQGQLQDSHFKGNVSGSGDYVGGLIGDNRGKINDSYVQGDVSGISSVGGLVGYNRGQINDSHSKGNVLGTGHRVGGLVGDNSKYFNEYGQISNSFATGEVSGSVHVGGFTGYNRGTIINSYATGDVSGSSSVGGFAGYNGGQSCNSYAEGNVSGSSSVGGLIGSNSGQTRKSFAKGNVSGIEKTGGLVGTNRSEISNSYALGIITGENEVGGLVGVNRDDGEVTTSYASGKVAGVEDFGGLIGLNGATIESSYWDIESTEQEQGIGRGLSGGTTGLTTAEMTGATVKVKMSKFDFIETWASLDFYYPHLSWEIEKITISSEKPTLLRGETTQVTVDVYLISNTITTATENANYISSNEEVAIIDTNGVVTALTGGQTTITASLATHDDEFVLTVLAPMIAIEPKLLDFEEIKIGEYSQRTIIVENLGDIDLEGNVELTDGSEYFSLLNGDAAYNLSSDETLEIEIQFKPLSFGTFESTIKIIHNADNEDDPFLVSLTGIGASPVTPLLVLPEDGAEGLQTDIYLKWNTAKYANTYSVQLSTDNDFEYILIDSTDIADTSITVQSLDYSTEYYWRVRGLNEGGYGEWSKIWQFTTVDVTSVDEELGTPTEFTLFQNYPNPFNPSTVIRYGIPERTHVTLTVYNSLGQRVTTLVNEEQEAQHHEITFNAPHLPSGVYIYRLQAGEYVESKKLLLLK